MTAQSQRSDPFAGVRTWKQKLDHKGWWHSFELPDGTRIDGVNTVEGLQHRISRFPIPEDLHGKRVLDIGAWDGWFSFEMERRGAEVMAVDNWDNPRFHQVHALLQSRVDYRQLDMYELAPERIGRFDIVLFMGVLYHLKHPLLALERVCALTTEMAAVDSFILREHHLPDQEVDTQPVMAFYENDEFAGQTDNWVAPSQACLLAFCRTAGFARVELQSVIEYSACVACYRRWEPVAPGAPPGPQLHDAVHNKDGGVNFNSQRDEYVSVFFDSPAEQLTREDVKPEVGGYGVKPLGVLPWGKHRWQADFKLPPGLAPGWHEVRVRVRGSGPGNALRIAVDLPLAPGRIRIAGARDGLTWTPLQVDLSRGDTLSLWIEGLPENADRHNLRVSLAGSRLEVLYIGPAGANPARQVNARVPAEAENGTAQLLVVVGDQRSEPVEIQVLGARAS